ncbi:hypothetical protein HD884_004524 [Ochrobactrum intermedium]|nr:hypothetical protein [Brucella intermedia]
MTSNLITRLSKLDAPDREVDGEIWRYLMSGEPRAVLHGPIPELTASIDAAIALAERVLPGWTWYLGNGANGSGNNSSVAGIYPPKSPEGTFKGDHPMPATALCIALLRAKEASK